MKKTISVNISGIIFNIEEDAFERLKKYLATIKGYFHGSEGQDEIIDDIELRIAELFGERVTSSKQVITDRDVSEIISIMGEPEDYLEEEDFQSTEQPRNERQAYSSSHDKKLFRDKEEGVVAGVCAGLAAYFQLDVVWIRIFWAAMVFFFGTGVLAYIIAMLIIPEAKTTSDKLRMKGDPIDVESIKKKVNEGFEKVKYEANHIKGKSRRGGLSDLLSRIVELIANVLQMVFKLFGSLIGVIFLIVGIGILVAVAGMLFNTPTFVHFNSDVSPLAFSQVMNGLFDSSVHGSMFLLGIVLLVGIPILTIVLVGFRILFKFQWPYKGISATLLTAWIIGLFVTIFSSLNLGEEFAFEDSIHNTIEINMPSDTLRLKVRDSEWVSHSVFFSKGHFRGFQIEDDYMSVNNVNLDVISISKDQKIKLEIIKSSKGRGYDDTEERIDNIEVNYELDGNTLIIDPEYRFPLEDKIRGQEARFVLSIPVGTWVYMEDKFYRIVDDMERDIDRSKRNLMDQYLYMSHRGLIDANDWKQVGAYE